MRDFPLHAGTVTDIVIQPLTATNTCTAPAGLCRCKCQTGLNRCDNSFTVEAELHLTVEDGRIGYTVEPVASYVKRYDPEICDAQVLHVHLRCAPAQVQVLTSPITPRGWPTPMAGSPSRS